MNKSIKCIIRLFKGAGLVIFIFLIPLNIYAFHAESALPLYIYPSNDESNWSEAILAGGDAIGFIVANVNDGPGTKTQTEWTSVIDKAVSRGIKVYGYVYSKYGNRAGKDVDKDVKKWFSLYPQITGIFIDETASDIDHLVYYKNRYDFVKRLNQNFQVVINPGAITNEKYMSVSDVNTIFESNYDSWKNLTVPEWVHKYSENRFYAIVYEVPTATDMINVLRQSAERNFGKIFVTDARTPSAPLPGYFDLELQVLKDLRGGDLVPIPIPPAVKIQLPSTNSVHQYNTPASMEIFPNTRTSSSIIVTSPLLGHIFKKGQARKISWVSENISYVRIILEKKDGSMVSVISDSVLARSIINPYGKKGGLYYWEIPYDIPTGNDYVISIHEIDGNAEGKSQPFIITAPNTSFYHIEAQSVSLFDIVSDYFKSFLDYLSDRF